MSQVNSGQAGNGGASRRGFASMDEQRQREIASKGGRAAHAQGRAHEFNPDEARAAGRKGGQEVSRNRAHMSEIGRRGGAASRGGRGRSVAGIGGTAQQGAMPARELEQRIQTNPQSSRSGEINSDWTPQ